MKYVPIIFSPTGGTQKAAELVTAAWSAAAEAAPTIDLTDHRTDFAQCRLEPEDLALIALPSYGGRAPALAAERLAKVQGNGAKCVLLCVYGNRDYEDTLVEMADIARACGFSVTAAIAAVAEHSIMHQFAAGRPDEQDEQQLKAFAEQIMAKIQAGEASEPTLPGNRPYKKAAGVPLTPKADGSCTGCGLCAEVCPAGAITKEQPNTTDAKKCIACMRCVTQCPQAARKVNGAMVAIAATAIKKACSVRKEAELFIAGMQ